MLKNDFTWVWGDGTAIKSAGYFGRGLGLVSRAHVVVSFWGSDSLFRSSVRLHTHGAHAHM